MYGNKYRFEAANPTQRSFHLTASYYPLFMIYVEFPRHRFLSQ